MRARVLATSVALLALISAGPLAAFELPNGFTANLLAAPSDGIMHAALLISAGWADDTDTVPRAAELISCAVIEGSGFDEAVRRVGGSTTHVVSPRETSIRVTAPIIKGPWVLNELAQLAFREPLRDEAVRKCWDKLTKAPGGLRPRAMRVWNDIDPVGWKRRDYFASVLGYTHRDFASARPSVESLDRWRDENYRTDGATLLCAGAFKEALFTGFVRDTFARLASRASKPVGATPAPLSTATYRRATVSPEDAHVHLGVHFASLGPEDETALRLYARAAVSAAGSMSAGIADRALGLAVDEHLDPSGSGYIALAATVPSDAFPRATELLADFVGGMAIATVFEDEAFQTLRKQWLSERGSMEFAMEQARFQRRHGKSVSLEATVLALEPAAARERVRRVLGTAPRYDESAAPPTFFDGERGLLCILAAIATMLFLRRRWLRPFDRTAVRYVRRVRYGLAPLLTCGLLVFIAAAGMRAVARMVANLLAESALWNASYWTSEYLFSAAYASAAVALIFFAASRLPRKLIVTEFGVVLKSFTFFSITIPLEDLDAVAVCRPHRLFSEPFRSARLRPFHWSLWGKGLLLRMKNGTSYYLGFTDAKQVQREFIRVWTKLRGRAPFGIGAKARRDGPPKLVA